MFGENLVSGCTLHLNRADLVACAALRTRIYRLQTLTASSIDYVGIFGNASVENIYDWINVISNPPTALTGSTAGVVFLALTLV